MENQLLLDLIKGEKLKEETLCAADWAACFDEARHQTVLPTALAAARSYRAFIPAEVFEKAETDVLRQYGQNLRSCGYLQELQQLLAEKKTDFCILKGLSSAFYWPAPELRAFGDCDFLVREEDSEAVARTLEERGCVRAPGKHPFHVGFHGTNGASLEMHFAVSLLPEGEVGETLRDFLSHALDSPLEMTVMEQPFPALMPEFHGLVLLLHAQQHMMGGGVGLRHLLDFGYFVSSTDGQPFWEEKLLPLLKQTGLFVYASVMAKACALFCGTLLPEWARDAEDDLCRGVVEDIMTGGNFGRKNKQRKSSGLLISRQGTGLKQGRVRSLYQVLHHSTPYVYPIVNKVKLLHPFLDSWRVLKYLHKQKKGERYSIGSLTEYADERKALYLRLHVFEK